MLLIVRLLSKNAIFTTRELQHLHLKQVLHGKEKRLNGLQKIKRLHQNWQKKITVLILLNVVGRVHCTKEGCYLKN